MYSIKNRRKGTSKMVHLGQVPPVTSLRTVTLGIQKQERWKERANYTDFSLTAHPHANNKPKTNVKLPNSIYEALGSFLSTSKRKRKQNNRD